MRYRRKQRLSWRRVGEQTVVVDSEGKRLYGLNASGGEIWHALDGEQPVGALADLFEGTTDDERRAAIEGFLEALEREGLVDRTLEAVGEAGAIEARVAWMAPEVAWREEIQTFARACAFHPGQNLICNTNPRS